MSSSKAFSASRVSAGGVCRDDGDKQRKVRFPKGYLPIMLVRRSGGNDDGKGGAATETETETETRMLVRVGDLKEPCMAALLEAAEEQFGFEQQGVLKVPFDSQRFHHVVNMARKSSKDQSSYY